LNGTIAFAPPRLEPDWAEFVIVRELYGLLQALGSRPFSKGHDGPVAEAAEQLRSLGRELEHVSHSLLADSHRATIRSFLDAADALPPEVVARTLLTSLHDALAGADDTLAPRSFVARIPDTLQPERLVVTVGATIGIGDEFLFARALAERAQELGGVDLAVSSHNADLWAAAGAGIQLLPPPPYGACDFAASLSASERSACGMVYLDFLHSDPSLSPYHGPPGLAYAARWSMGSSSGDAVDLGAGMEYVVRYPDGLPNHHWLASRWAAGQLLPGRAVAVTTSAWPEPPARDGCRIVAQVLTAKPGLTYDPTFYADVFARVLARRPEVTVEIVPGPTETGYAQTQAVADEVAAVNPEARVELRPSMTLAQVFDRLRGAALLFGPDTFSAHFAAELGLPQVTISMPEHRSWVSVGSPCLSVVSDRDSERVAATSADCILAYLDVLDGAPSGARLRDSLRSLDGLVLAYLRTGLVASAEEVRRHAEGFDPDVYGDGDDMMRALARWYHERARDPDLNLTVAA
jgi:hypothetical protein